MPTKVLIPHDLSNQYANFFLSGDKFTAKQLNALVGFNDARKTISVLRHKEGWKIEDCRLSNGCKLYWLAEKGGANE